MPFVKLDCGMLDSSIWPDREARELFICALLMAEPFEIEEPEKTYLTTGIVDASFVIPPGWYGKVNASGAGIVRRCGMEQEAGFKALVRLGEPDRFSRTPDFEGRRMVRVDGGYIVLNYDKHRRRDHSAAERQRRYRERLRESSQYNNATSHATSRSVTQAEGEADGRRTPLPRSSPSDSPLSCPSPSPKAPAAEKPWPTPHEELQPFRRWWTNDVPDLHRAAQRKFVEDFDPFMETLERAYGHVDLVAELAAAYAWEEANGSKTPKGRKRFLRAWVERAANDPKYRKPAGLQPYGQAVPR